MSEQSEEEKQNYLRENIIEKGYEAEDFVTFLTEKKGEEFEEGIDLNYFSFDELKLLVQEYILKQSKIAQESEENIFQNPPQMQPYSQPNINNIQDQNQNMTNNINYINNDMAMNSGTNINYNMNNNINNNINNYMNNTMNNNMNIDINNMDNNINNMNAMNNNISYNNNISNDNTIYNQNNDNYINGNEETDIYGVTNLESIQCLPCEQSELSKYENIHIEMNLGEKVEGKFLSKSYMTFRVTTFPLNLNVRRRYSDFEWLRKVLLYLYSSSIIPPIPKKNKINQGGRFGELFLLKRKRNLEKFLNILLDDPYIKISQILYDFLSIEKENEFNEKKKYYNSIKMPKNLSEYKTPSSKLEIVINEENELYYQNIKEYAENSYNLLTKFNKNLKLLNNEMNSIVKRMEEISQISEELFFISNKHYDTDPVKISYIQLRNMFKDWSDLINKQSCIFNVNLREYFKYNKNIFRSIKELSNIIENNKQNYYKSKRNLITKKEELFKKGDIGKWDLGPNKNLDITVETLLKDKNVALPKMLYKETNNVIYNKQIYGYYLNRIISEYMRIRKMNTSNQTNNILENTKMQTKIISELLKNITDIVSNDQKYSIKNIEKDLNIAINSEN